MSARPESKVLLLGLMGAGKTTVGHALARLTGWTYHDNDALLQQAVGMTAPELLEQGGEPVLRRAESDALTWVLAADPPLVAGVAAGVVLDPGDKARLAAARHVVWLRAPVPVLAQRVGSGEGRSWLEGDPESVLRELAEVREPLFAEVADQVVDVSGSTPEEIADAIRYRLPD